MPIDPRSEPLAVIGSGSAGLITAHTLIKDGFQHVQILTQDQTVGGVWSFERVYPSLTLNNVHGEFRFSGLPMPPLANFKQTGGHLTGYHMHQYFQDFADKFLEGRIRFSTKVLKITRDNTQAPLPWLIHVRNGDGSEETLKYSRVVLCTGGCHTPKIPSFLSSSAAQEANFKGFVAHSRDFGKYREEILSKVPSVEHGTDANDKVILIVGGGKSSQDMAAYLASQGRRTTIVFETMDSFVASAKPLPDYIRRGRSLSVFASHSELRSNLEKFLHTTWLGNKIVQRFWKNLEDEAFTALSIPEGSPLRNTQSIFWSCRINDEGVPRDDSYFSLVNAGKIEVIAPARVSGYTSDGVILDDGRRVKADVVLLATGYTSSWNGLVDEETAEAVGLNRHEPLSNRGYEDEWPYTTLECPPKARPAQEASSIYRGLVPVKNIMRRDLAVNGAVLTTNNGYVFEVCAHWISSYFLNDAMRLPSSVEEALEDTERHARWIRKRFPNQLLWLNESYSAAVYFHSWPQYADQLLEDLGLPSGRSGGNWLTWAFTPIDLKEIENLTEERMEKRKM